MDVGHDLLHACDPRVKVGHADMFCKSIFCVLSAISVSSAMFYLAFFPHTRATLSKRVTIR